MKTAVIVLLALVAFAAAQVHVVDHNPSEVHVVDRNPYEVHVVDRNPSEVHVVDHNPSEVHVVDHDPTQVNFVDHNPSVVVDQGFYRPSNPPNGGYEQISTGPAYVDFGNRPYAGKHYDNPNLRGGK
ncbi:PREDICTED: uncharacterized protein LOC106102606 isoform X2 [Papilio polytes]|uniref:uncharacterized protein LOC106102606 isoform X2 n=1 Tax=Papilio polytes TaxID=76194 RepID=UPI0006767E7F|nr:PREDICTED: uncharacterized protein LOC106102606 isoform X2 [Papilio polytes]